MYLHFQSSSNQDAEAKNESDFNFFSGKLTPSSNGQFILKNVLWLSSQTKHQNYGKNCGLFLKYLRFYKSVDSSCAHFLFAGFVILLSITVRAVSKWEISYIWAWLFLEIAMLKEDA